MRPVKSLLFLIMTSVTTLLFSQHAVAGKSCATLDRHNILARAAKYQSTINKYSALYGVDNRFVIAVMTNESCFKPRARSYKGAKGLMQLMPAAAERFGVRDRYHPEQNIRGGVKYLAFLIRRFNGDLPRVIAGYHAGEGNVAKYGGVPPFRSTRNYVRNVSHVLRKLGAYQPRLTLNRASAVAPVGQLLSRLSNKPSLPLHHYQLPKQVSHRAAPKRVAKNNDRLLDLSLPQLEQAQHNNHSNAGVGRSLSMPMLNTINLLKESTDDSTEALLDSPSVAKLLHSS
ncbi:MAG TPA: lytic transglycosylase domain-containing protein [Thiothrix sp.]|nr:lytic transglycosylase domain-containing protein [Thiothrix sp.]